MPSISLPNTDDNHYELGEEFQKLASLIPTIPKDQSFSELELIEFVIAYIRQLQQLLSEDQWNECFNKLTVSMKNSFLTILGSSPMSNNEHSSGNSRNPLATLNLDNTQLS